MPYSKSILFKVAQSLLKHSCLNNRQEQNSSLVTELWRSDSFSFWQTNTIERNTSYLLKVPGQALRALASHRQELAILVCQLLPWQINPENSKTKNINWYFENRRLSPYWIFSETTVDAKYRTAPHSGYRSLFKCCDVINLCVPF